MATPYLSEIKIFSFNYAPRGWAMCNGQILPINQNQALFSLMGTFYGGDGRVSFALPNLQGRVATGLSAGTPIGTASGEESHTLTAAEMPAHLHIPNCGTAAGTLASPANAFWASESGGNAMYGAGLPDKNLATDVVRNTGGGLAHENRMPYLALNFCIALQGIFPSRN